MPEFDLALRYYSGLPDGYLDDFRASLPADQFRVNDDEVPPRTVAAMEWVVPTAIAIYIAKPFIDVIFKRAADDFADVVYPRLKSGIASLAKKVFIRERLPLSRVTRDSPSEAPAISFFSIYSETTTTTRIKFVFTKPLPEHQYDTCIEQLFELLEEHHQSQDGMDALSSGIAVLPENRRNQIFLVYDDESDAWEVRDPIQESLDTSRGTQDGS